MKIIKSDKFFDVVECQHCGSTTTLTHPAGKQYRCCWCNSMRYEKPMIKEDKND